MEITGITDPVPAAHAAAYSAASYASQDNERELQAILGRLGGSIAGWRVLDLGGGPGQFSSLLAKAGGEVVWHDISPTYCDLAQRWCEKHNVRVEFQLGTLEDLGRYSDGSFNLVFSRVCWYYASKERHLYEQVRRILKPGGYAWIHTSGRGTIGMIKNPATRAIYGDLYALHEITGIKLAHVPARGARLHRWFFASGDFECRHFEEADRNVKLLGRRR